jgi:hypothetical protein
MKIYKSLVNVFASIVLINFLSCNNCSKSGDCQENNINFRIKSKTNIDVLGTSPTSSPPIVYFKNNKGERTNVSVKMSGNTAVVTQTLEKLYIEFENVIDSLSLINPMPDRETECCRLPFADSVLINNAIRASTQKAIIQRQ